MQAYMPGVLMVGVGTGLVVGAVGLGDLGEHFPDTDPAFEGIPGHELLGRVVVMLAERGYGPAGCDLTVLAACRTDLRNDETPGRRVLD